MNKTYLEIIRGQLDKLEQTQEEVIDRVARFAQMPLRRAAWPAFRPFWNPV